MANTYTFDKIKYDGNTYKISAASASLATASTPNAVAYFTDTNGTFGSKASANGALYATSADGALQFGTLPVGQGGTGKTSWTQWGVVYASASTTLTNTAAGTAGYPLIGQGSAAPAWYAGTVFTGTAAGSWKTSINGTTSPTASAQNGALEIAGGAKIAKQLYVTDGVRIIKNTGASESTQDAILYIENKDASDWAQQINKDTSNNGLYIKGTGSNLLRVGTNSVLDISDNSTAKSRIVSVKGRLELNRTSDTSFGRISFYSPSYYTWFLYMSNSAAGCAPTGGQPSTTTEVTNWALRSLIESTSGYGWIWEATANAAAADTSTKPTARMSLSSNTGRLTVEANAATSTTRTSHLILSSSANGSSGNVALEFWRGSNASWQIANESGVLIFRNNYTTAAQTTYSQQSITLSYNTGTLNVKNVLPQTTGTYALGASDNVFVGLYTGALTIGAGTASTDAGKTISSSSTLYLVTSSSASIIFKTNNTNRGRFDTDGYFRPESTNSGQLGSASYRWGKLYIGTADSYGASNLPIYWNAGVPKACDYYLKATVNNATQWGVAYYSTTTNITSTAAGTAGYPLIGAGSAAPAWYGGQVNTGTAAASWVTSFNGTTASTSTTTGAVKVAGGLGVAGQVTATRVGAGGSNTSYTLYSSGTSYLVGVTTHGGNVVSDTNATDSLGTTSVRWQYGYFTNSVLVGAKDTAWNSAANNSYISAGEIGVGRTGSAGGGYYCFVDGTSYSRLYVSTLGTAAVSDGAETPTYTNTTGFVTLQLGNSKQGTSGNSASVKDNARGEIYLYGANTRAAIIRSLTNDYGANRYFYVPNYNSNMYAAHTGGTDAVGTATKPVYVAANGRITVGTYELKATVNYAVNAATSAGTAKQAAYYSAANTISGSSVLTIESNRICITANSNTVSIGSQNANWCHIYNSASIPFIFNNTVTTTSGDLGNEEYPWGEINWKGLMKVRGNRSRYSYSIMLYNNAGTLFGEQWYDRGNATNITRGQWSFREYSPNSTNDTGTTGYYETYNLPNVTTGRTTNASYDIYTTKNNPTFLDLYEARGTTTNLNKAAGYSGVGRMFHLVASSSTTTGKTPTDANILQMNWDNNGGYDSQFGIATSGNRAFVRSQVSAGTAWSELVRITAGTAVGSGTGPVYVNSSGVVTACGSSLAVSVTGSSASCTGNAATASKLTDITTTDAASSSATWRRVWISYNDNTTGRPAYTDSLAYQTSTNTLKTPHLIISSIAHIGAAEYWPVVVNSSNEAKYHKVTISTSAPSGGSNGDVWYKYTT